MLIEYYIKSSLGQAYHDNECQQLESNMVNKTYVEFAVRSTLKLKADIAGMTKYLSSRAIVDIPERVESHNGTECILDDEITVKDLSKLELQTAREMISELTTRF